MYSPAKGAHAVRDSLLKSLQRHKANQYAVFATSDQYSPQKVAHQFDDALVVRSSQVQWMKLAMCPKEMIADA
jgi:hypothetical protein